MSAPTNPPAGSPHAGTNSGTNPGPGAPASRSVEPTARQRWHRSRGALVIAAVLVLGGLASALLLGRTEGGPLDPASARQSGGRALAVLLDDRGVGVRRVDNLAGAVRLGTRGTTLVVAQPDLLAPAQLDRLVRAGSGHLVLFAPGEEALRVLAPDAVRAGDTLVPATRTPGCGLRAARRAGPVHVDGPMYRALPGARAVGCYGDGSRFGLLRLGHQPTAPPGGSDDPGPTARIGGGRTVDVVGPATSFANSRLTDDGNAALALNLLGTERELVWYVPSAADPSAVPSGAPGGREPRSLTSLLPDGVRFGAGQAAVAVALLMLAASRRLGPVVPEPLPVAVRASEAVEGRARLYQRARARARAADALRAATAARLAPLLGHAHPDSSGSRTRPGLAPGRVLGQGPDTLVAAVADRTGRDGGQVRRLLAECAAGGQTPEDDAALVRLAAELDTLEQEVRRS
ncbi:DUF4350 domain-containing protein [Actinopolymorpha sp. NPDC004070]|uniref:DUF4350 domain-containing protein n=1 Tax=Actinopolymorpha sp. NPDC004070 TaxID=3154548 RepID=UPI00339E2B90